jgi:hypothetical protein
MNANELADVFTNRQNWKLINYIHWSEQSETMLRQLQAEIEALKMGFANSGTHDSELAETRAMAGRLFLKVQDLEFEQEGYENLTEMLESEKAELTEKNCQQQAEIEALKQIIDANNLNQNIGQFVKPTNKPVAWMNIHGQFNKKETWLFPIPLYTHPVKEPSVCIGYWDYKTGAFHKVLTELQQKRVDEGFLQPVYTAGMLRVKELTDEEIRHIQAICHLKDVGYDGFIMRFARAILLKAQEK